MVWKATLIPVLRRSQCLFLFILRKILISLFHEVFSLHQKSLFLNVAACNVMSTFNNRKRNTARNAVISPNFLVWEFCRDPPFRHSFWRFFRKYAKSVCFYKISRIKLVNSWNFMQLLLSHCFTKVLYFKISSLNKISKIYCHIIFLLFQKILFNKQSFSL